MAWTLYKSTDASAPVLTGQTGSLITLLDAVLVNGYGSQPAAGWTKAYSGTSKAAYRNGSASISRTYWRVQDDGPGSQTFKEARTRLYSTMSDVDTGTLPTPTVAQSTPGIVVRKSNTADATARAWFILADDKTAIICITPGDTASGYTDMVSPVYVGDPYAYLSADAQGAVLCGRVAEAMTTMADVNGIGCSNIYGNGSVVLGYIAGSYSGVAGSMAVYGSWPALAHAHISSSSSVSYPNEADGAVYVCGPLLVWTNVSSVYTLRGHLRGLASFPHLRSAVNAWDTVTGAGDLSGHSYILNAVGAPNSTVAVYHHVLAFETTAPAYST